MKSFLKYLAPVSIILCVGLAIFFIANQRNSEQKSRSEYVDFITNHPFANRKMTIEDLHEIPKVDRPDLAAEHNFLQVVDPQLKRIPSERLAQAYQITKQRLQEVKDNSAESSRKTSVGIQEFPTEEVESVAIAGVNWSERGPNNVGGRTRALMWDPNDVNSSKLWAGSVSGGIWFNNDITDPSSSWVPVDDFLSSLAISSFAYDPNNTSIFYAGTGEGFIAGNGGGGVAGAGLFVSTDAGSTWDVIPSTIGPDYRYIQKVIVTANSTLLITTRPSLNEGGSGGVFRSTNGGDSWTRVINGRGADLQLASNGDIYASTGVGSGSGQVWRSVDDGVNWVEVTPPGGNPLWIELAVAPSQSSETESTIIYALAQDRTTLTTVTWLQRSGDGGATWTNLEVPRYREQSCALSTEDFTRGQAFYDLIVAVQPDNADVVTIGGIDIYRSINAGEDFELVSYWTGGCDDFVHADQHEAAYRPGFPTEAVFGHDGGVSYSPDVGDFNIADPSFETVNNNYSVTQFYAVAIRNETGSGNFLAGSQDNGTQRFSDASGATTSQAVGGDGTFCHIDQSDGTYQIASVQFNSIFHSSNGGQSFVRLTNQNTSHAFINPTDLDNASHILYAAAAVDQYMIIREIDSDNPSAEEFISVDVGNISHINANSTTTDRLFVGTRQGDIFRIDNAASSEAQVTNITGNISSSGNVSSNDQQLLATYSNFGVTSVWLSTDGGVTWTSKDEASHGLPDIPVRWSLFNPKNTAQVLLATELGIWSTDNILAADPDWEPTSNNLANVRCDMLQYRTSDDLVAVATFGRGVFTTDVFSTTQDVVPPSIVSLTPSDDQTEVLFDQNLIISFNETIQAGNGNITIFRSSDDSVFETISVNSGQVTISSATLTIDPTNDLESITSYYVTLDAGIVTDSNGNQFAGIQDKLTWSFETFDGDFPPTLITEIPNFFLATSSPPLQLDLSEYFEDLNMDEFEYSIISNSNASLVTLNFPSTSILEISVAADAFGSSTIVLRGATNGDFVEDQFSVTVNPPTILFSQSGVLAGSTPSQQFPDFGNNELENADDFTVPQGTEWSIYTVEVVGRNNGNPPEEAIFRIYEDDSGEPGTQIFESDVLDVVSTLDESDFQLLLETPLVLSPGNYWISVLDVQAFGSENTQWFWGFTTGGNGYLRRDPGQLLGGSWGVDWEQGTSSGAINGDLLISLLGTLPIVDPTDLLLSESDNQVIIDWTDNATNEANYVIERSISGGEFEVIATLDPNTSTFSDDIPATNTLLEYRIQAILSSEIQSGYLSDQILTLAAPPTLLEASDVTLEGFTINWESLDGANEYEVDISTDNFASYVPAFDSVTVLVDQTFSVAGFDGGIYQYRVRAVNASGLSANSETGTVEIITLGIGDLERNELEMKVFPNPGSQFVSLQLPEEIRATFHITISDLSGRVMETIVLNSDSLKKYKFDVSDWSAGTYLVAIRSDSYKSSSRFIKRE